MLRRLTPGTKVWAEGPYGVFTAAARHGERVTAFAAGVGITPVRAVLDDLPSATDVTIVYRSPRRRPPRCAPSSTRSRPRTAGASTTSRARARLHPITPALLFSVAPGIAESDVFVCGPTAFTDAVVSASTKIGVPDERIHHETFAF